MSNKVDMIESRIKIEALWTHRFDFIDSWVSYNNPFEDSINIDRDIWWLLYTTLCQANGRTPFKNYHPDNNEDSDYYILDNHFGIRHSNEDSDYSSCETYEPKLWSRR